MQDAATTLLATKSAVVGAWLILIILAEGLAPAPGTGGRDWRRVGRNGALWAINLVLAPLVIVPLSAWAAQHGAFERPLWWTGATGFVLDLLLLDFLIYWWHRFNHRLPLLWRFHAIHHLDRALDATTALRFHFGEVLISAFLRAGVIMLMAPPLVSVIAFESLVLIATIFHHSKLRLPPRLEAALARLVVTPSIHWVHHHRRMRDTDANYATILSLWDPLFASRAATRRTPAMEIGVEGRDEMRLSQLLPAPFQPGTALAPGRGSVQ